MVPYLIKVNSKEELEEIVSKAVINALERKIKGNEKDKNEILTTDELCSWLKLSRVTVWQLTKNGILPFIRIGNQKRYLKSDVLKKMKEFKSNVL